MAQGMEGSQVQEPAGRHEALGGRRVAGTGREGLTRGMAIGPTGARAPFVWITSTKAADSRLGRGVEGVRRRG